MNDAALKAQAVPAETHDKLLLEDVYKIFGPKPSLVYPLLEQGVSKDEIFRQTGHTVAAQAASFTIRTGEVFVVMGLSGSGKSTLVRMINRLIDPTAGSIRIDGQDITTMPLRDLIALRRRNMSMVFQSFALMPHQSVLENAAFGLNIAGVSAHERRRKALHSLEKVGLAANADSYPHELSGGMKQRVGLARALAVDPEILLMDEAFSALDPLIRTQMQDELVALQERDRRTIVFISHDLDEAIRIGDRIAVMQDGRVVQVGTPQQIVLQPVNEYVRSFFHGVDVAHVLTAGDIAQRANSNYMVIGPATLTQVQSRMQADQRRSATLVDEGGKFLGIVTQGTVTRALESGETGAEQAIASDLEPLNESLRLNDLFDRVADSEWPVPVIDDSRRYVGRISRADLLRTLRQSI